MKAITIALLLGTISAVKVESKSASKASALSEANMLAAAESMAKAKLHAKAHTKREETMFNHIFGKEEPSQPQ